MIEPDKKGAREVDPLDQLPPEVLERILKDAQDVVELYAPLLRALSKY